MIIFVDDLSLYFCNTFVKYFSANMAMISKNPIFQSLSLGLETCYFLFEGLGFGFGKFGLPKNVLVLVSENLVSEKIFLYVDVET